MNEGQRWAVPLFVWIVGVVGIAFAAAAVAPDGWRRVLTVLLIVLAGVGGPLAWGLPGRWRVVSLMLVMILLIAAFAVAVLPSESFRERCIRRHGQFEDHSNLLERANGEAPIRWQECYDPPLPAGVAADGYAEINSQYFLNPDASGASDDFAVQLQDQVRDDQVRVSAVPARPEQAVEPAEVTIATD